MSANQNPVYDHELVARLRMSDESAFDALYMAYYAKLWRYAYSYTKSRDIAEEIVQDFSLPFGTGVNDGLSTTISKVICTPPFETPL